jgi:hypothetical protein
MKESVKLNYIPKDVELNGLMFAQTDYKDGEQSVGNANGAACAIGRIHTGNEIKVYFEIDPGQIEARKKDSSKTYPVVGGGSDKPKLAVLEQLTKVEGSENEYVAKWRSVLQAKKRDLMPLWGIGRLEADFGKKSYWSDEVNEFLLQLKELKSEMGGSENPMELESKKEQLEKELLNAHKSPRISAVYALHHEMICNVEPTKEALNKVLYGILEKYSVDGLKAGAILRVRQGDKILASLSAEIRRSVNFSGKAVDKVLPLEGVEETIDKFYKYSGGEYILSTASKDDSMEIDVIPEVIVNGGPLTNSKYKKDYIEYRKLMSTYYDHHDVTKGTARFMAVRLNENSERDEDDEKEGNYMLTAAHAISANMGHFLEMDSDYKTIYEIDYTNVKFDLVEKNDGKRFLAFGKGIKKVKKDD